MAQNVFISYSMAGSDVPNAVCKAFDANGISYWIDKDEVVSGESFAKRIVPAIKSSKITVFLSSQNSNKSVYTVKEIVIAFNNGKHIITFRIENIGFSYQLEFFLCDLSWINAFENLQSNLQQLVASIKKLLDINEQPPTSADFVIKKTQKLLEKVNTTEPVSVPTSSKPQILTETVNDVSFNMVAVKGGTYMIDCQTNEPNRSESEVQHKVALSSFFIGETVVTQALWKAVMGNNPCYYKGENNPVEQVSWYDAVNFCNELSKLKGLQSAYIITSKYTFLKEIKLNSKTTGFRLPTEAEWEFPARGGKQSKGYTYAGSNNLDTVAWCGNNSRKTNPVAQKQPNELGIYDMSGNVWEWIWDYYSLYSASPKTNNVVDPGLQMERVVRGGSWNYDANYYRLDNRYYFSPNLKLFYIGFRLFCP